MYSSILSASVFGLTARKIRVEADVSNGLPGAVMVGYLAGQVRETMDRVRTALKNSDFALEPKKLTVNLAPAGFKKEGSFFDLPVALAILSAYGLLEEKHTEGLLVVGELGLNGEVCPVSGILPVVLEAKREGCWACMVPWDNVKEAEYAGILPVIGVKTLKEAVSFLSPEPRWKTVSVTGKVSIEASAYTGPDFRDIRGQQEARRAAEIAVSGFHNLLLIGPPGSGKSMLASRIPSILPGLSRDEVLEISSIYSIAGLLNTEHPLVTKRPFRAPHHTITTQALSGGGRIPRPGEISLAHRGVLFLDELPEFPRMALEVLRQPLENRKILISRSNYSEEFPADFLLLAAMNPCKCGYYPDLTRCTCTEREIHGYLHRISRPLLDRMDLSAEMSRIPFEELLKKPPKGTKEEDSAAIRSRVEKVQKIQARRYERTSYRFNGDLDSAGVQKYCALGAAEEKLLEGMYQKFSLTARSCHRLLKVARTLADMDESENIGKKHLAEAAAFRAADEKYWG